MTSDMPQLGARRNGRAIWVRNSILTYVAQRGHAHYLARDGEWCVTAAQVGMLWEHLRRAGERTS